MRGGGVAGLDGVRILEVTERYPPAVGGVERHVYRLAEELHRAGAEVEVVTTDLERARPFRRREYSDGQPSVPVHRHRAVELLPAPQGLGVVAPDMLAELLRSDVDIVHAHAFARFPTWAGRLTRGARGLPLVVTPHSDPGADTLLTRAWSGFVARSTLRGADRTIALSRSEAVRLARLGVRPERISVIPNGIDLDEFDRMTPRPSVPDRFSLLFVGRLDWAQKGLDTLVDALALLRPRVDVSLTVVGPDWGGVRPMRERALAHGVADRISVRGEVSRTELLRAYAESDVFVLPSRFDSFPIVLLEAMASGLPIVATRVGGVPDLVGDSGCGSLVPPGDAPALAGAIAQLLDDEDSRRRMSERARSVARSYAWSSLVPAYVQLFGSLARAA